MGDRRRTISTGDELGVEGHYETSPAGRSTAPEVLRIGDHEKRIEDQKKKRIERRS